LQRLASSKKGDWMRLVHSRKTALFVCIVGMALAAACANPANPADPIGTTTPAYSLNFSRMVDLSHTITQDMPHLPDEPATRFEERTCDNLECTGAVYMSTRSGTHMQIISRSAHKPLLVEHLSPRDLVVPAVVLDVRDHAQDNPTYRLSAASIAAWETRHGTLPPGCVVLLATGWDTRWGSAADYLNLNNEQSPEVPGVGRAALVLLLHERRVYGVGIDTPTIDATIDTTIDTIDMLAPGATPAAENDAHQSDTHDLWIILENLTRLEQLPPTGTTLVIGTLGVQNSDAAPARVLAFIP
jgi:kynurenine formamidase